MQASAAVGAGHRELHVKYDPAQVEFETHSGWFVK
jgi:hypothetical protein